MEANMTEYKNFCFQVLNKHSLLSHITEVGMKCPCILIPTSCANMRSLARWYSSSRSSIDLLLLSSFNRIRI